MMEQLNENILQSITTGLLTVDLDGQITFVNRAAEGILGWRRGQVLGRSIQDVLGPQIELPRLVEEILQNKIARSTTDLSLTYQDGQESRVTATVSALRDEREEVIGAIIILTDAANGASGQAPEQGSVTMEQMAAVLAHTIRNRLAGIGTGVQYLAGKYSPDDPLHGSIESILSAVTDLNQLIEDILLASRPVQLHLASCHIVDVLDSALSKWQAEAEEHGVTIETRYAPHLPPLHADAMSLSQAFSNILSNAIEAMPRGGHLEIAVTQQTDPQTEGERAGHIEIKVADSGPGIPDDLLDRIFEPFLTTKTNGMGLGLTIASRIVNQHGGSISARSQEGVGTTFYIRLPTGVRS
jgi:PAS domain S-box-containing protein